MKSVIVGTAGHIDHGKTALVKALTGIDADRLEEEKRRGITIDLGFAHMELPGPGGERLRLGFVDVPGHERFVRNMLAGVGGIDLVLLVIAADEGIKPQTREHFDICRLLSIGRGLTVLTKADLVDRETLDVVRMEVEEFLRGSFLDPATAPIVAVSALTGAGLEELRCELARVAARATARDSAALFRLPVDRVFTMKGFGTVVTGTLVAGTVQKEDEVEVFPAGKRVRVRGIQVHGAAAEQAVAGQRTALNLAGVEKEQLARGMVLAAPGLLRPTQTLDVSLSLLPSAKPLKDRSRVHFHAYTAETVADVRLYAAKELAPAGSSFAQLRLAEPTLLLPGDRFILRQFSPVVTIGGGSVVDATPVGRFRQVLAALPESLPAESAVQLVEAHVGYVRLDRLAGGAPEDVLQVRVERRELPGLSLRDAVAETGWMLQHVDNVAARLKERGKILRFGDVLVDTLRFEGGKIAAVVTVAAFQSANPLVAGMSKETLREELGVTPELFHGLLEALVKEKKLELCGELVRLVGRGVQMKDEEAEAKQTIERAFAAAGLKVPLLKDVLAKLPVDRARAQKIVTLLLRDNVLVKLSEELAFHRDALEELRRTVTAAKASTPRLNVAQFKELTGVTRKYAIPLLEWLDRERVTRRVGDERVIL